MITLIMPNVVMQDAILRHPGVIPRRNTTFGKMQITQIKTSKDNLCNLFKICVIRGL